MRSIDKIIVHCSAGNMHNTAADIAAYHTRAVSKGGRGWSTAGYHYFVEADGTTTCIVPEERISNGCKGQNAHAINVCYAGGVNQKDFRTPEDTRTAAQKAALLTLLRRLRAKYPQARIYGHRDFANKPCPSFDARAEYAGI